jgi:plastocyanin
VGIPAMIQLADARGFVLTLLAIAVVGTALVWRFDAIWARLLGILACLGVAFLMSFAVFGLLHPASFIEFVAAVTFVLGVPLALVGNILAMVQRRRGNLATAATSGERHVVQAVAGIVALAVVVSGALALIARESVDETLAANATEVEMSGFEFDPEVIEVVSGDQVLVRNRDAFTHDFTVPDLDLEATVGPGNEVLLDVEGAAGTYVVYCTLHSDTGDPEPDPEDNMVASLVVR